MRTISLAICGSALLIVCTLLNAQPLAYIDLSVPPKTTRQPFGRASVSNRGGGCFDCLKDGSASAPYPLVEPALRASIERLDIGSGLGTMEVLITNIDKTLVRVPVGLEAADLLAPPAPLRCFLSFDVCIGDCSLASIVSSAEAASNGDRAESGVDLKPGESISFKLPFDKAADTRKLGARARSR